MSNSQISHDRIRLRELEDIIVRLAEYFMPQPGETLSDAIMSRMKEERIESFIAGMRHSRIHNNNLEELIDDARKYF